MVKEIVGAKIGSIITNSLETMKKAAIDGVDIQLLSRQEMSFMSGCDLGINWDKMAQGDTLFLFNDETGECSYPVSGVSHG